MHSSSQALIFRKKLLPYSETFIADQGNNLARYRAVYVGFEKDTSGIGLLKDAEKLLLEEFSSSSGAAKLRHRLGFSTNKKWLQALRETQSALIHAHFVNDGIDAVRLGRQLDIPLITTLHGHDITKNEKKSVFKKDAAFLFNRADKIIAVSDYIAGHALRKGCPESKLIQHYIGIDIDRFQQVKQESEQPQLLFVGRLVEKKGCTYLLQAMAQLKKKYPELSLTIVGNGRLKSQLQAEAIQRNLRVDFVGTENSAQIRERLASAWLFVAPSVTADNGDAEGLGMVFLEAQALQTPVVSFNSGGVVEAVAHESTGLLCAEKDVSSLAENIDSLLQSERLRQTFGQQGRARVQQKFDIKKQCKLLESIYDDVCNQV